MSALRSRSWSAASGGAALTLTLALLPLSACGGDDAEAPRSGGGTTGGRPGLSGVLSYEFVPNRGADAPGLDYARTIQRRIRGASVHLLSASGDAEIAVTTSGEDGSYSFEYDGPALVKLWIYSETADPPISVQDNTAGGAVYVAESAAVDTGATGQLDFLAKTGWGGAAYTAPRAAAPFAILDALYGAAQRFRREVSPPPAFTPIHVNWSVDNRPEDGDPAKGLIGTSNWDGEQLYILGKADIDTDEFDSHILVHEWGHYFESALSRSDSLGGAHGFGDVLDPRVAFSEGWGNALSAMILDPDTVYIDTSGPRQADGFADDLEKNDASGEARPGWFSETSVQQILFDLYDGPNEPFDQVGVGLPGIYAAMTGGVKDTDAMTTLFPFVSALKAANPQAVAGIDALVTHHTANALFGLDRIADAWGTGETHGGGVAGSLPVYVVGSAPGAFTVGMTGGADFNTLAQNRFIRLTGQGARVRVSARSSADIDLYVYQKGSVLAAAETPESEEQVSFQAERGETYVINVLGYNEVEEDYAVAVEISD